MAARLSPAHLAHAFASPPVLRAADRARLRAEVRRVERCRRRARDARIGDEGAAGISAPQIDCSERIVCLVPAASRSDARRKSAALNPRATWRAIYIYTLGLHSIAHAIAQHAPASRTEHSTTTRPKRLKTERPSLSQNWATATIIGITKPMQCAG